MLVHLCSHLRWKFKEATWDKRRGAVRHSVWCLRADSDRKHQRPLPRRFGPEDTAQVTEANKSSVADMSDVVEDPGR